MSPNNSSATNPGRRRCTEARAANDYPGCLRTGTITPQTARGRPVFALISGGCDVYITSRVGGGSRAEQRKTNKVRGGRRCVDGSNKHVGVRPPGCCLCSAENQKRPLSKKKEKVFFLCFFPLKCVKMCLCHQSPPKAGDVWKITVESLLLFILMAPQVCLSGTATKAKDLQIHDTEALLEGQQTDLLLTLFQHDSKQLLPSLNESNFYPTNIF